MATVKKTIRRKNTLSRLQTQLKEKTKMTKEGKVELTEKNIIRIKKEIEMLKSRI